MTFDSDLAIAAEDLFEHFGRTITFRPATGEPRSVEVILGSIEDSAESDEFDTEEREQLWVEVRRDQSHASGGIAQPQTGDRFEHPDETDNAVPTPFAYQGRRRNVNPTTHELLFGRPKQEGKGIVSRHT